MKNMYFKKLRTAMTGRSFFVITGALSGRPAQDHL